MCPSIIYQIEGFLLKWELFPGRKIRESQVEINVYRLIAKTQINSKMKLYVSLYGSSE